jgi:WXG100 family type VII secretion target
MTTSVDVQGMVLAQQDFQEALDAINTVYASMTTERDNLVASWRGEAASAFGVALEAWLDDLHTVQEELVIITETLAVHTKVYADTAGTSKKTADAFKNGLGGLDHPQDRHQKRLVQASSKLEPEWLATPVTPLVPGNDPPPGIFTGTPGTDTPGTDTPGTDTPRLVLASTRVHWNDPLLLDHGPDDAFLLDIPVETRQ